ncbi:hypothetical protein [Enterococcus sp. S86.2]|uniref:hypothetical protein n=1 Tax=Enterococcus sp. S86.2 TaxID=3031299 RepID=UPI0026F28046|nr:hypothetical protein [Enterococcus sp. S86.2]
MKKFLAAGLMTMTLLSCGNSAFAKVESDTKGSTDLNITVLANENPELQQLKLINVPDRFEQTTTLNATGNYTVDFTDQNIKDDSDSAIKKVFKNNYVVFNDTPSVSWNLKASLNKDKVDEAGKTNIATGNKAVTITKFTVEGKKIYGAGADGDIIFSSQDVTEKAGFLMKKFESGAMEFKDHDFQLKQGDKIDVENLVLFTLTALPEVAE